MRRPTFSKAGATTVTFSRGEGFPIIKTTDKRQDIGISAGGAVVVNTLTENKDIFYDFSFQLLNDDDITNLNTFFDDSNVDWAAKTFTYTDTEDRAVEVRLIEHNLTESQTSQLRYTIAFILREET